MPVYNSRETIHAPRPPHVGPLRGGIMRVPSPALGSVPNNGRMSSDGGEDESEDCLIIPSDSEERIIPNKRRLLSLPPPLPPPPPPRPAASHYFSRPYCHEGEVTYQGETALCKGFPRKQKGADAYFLLIQRGSDRQEMWVPIGRDGWPWDGPGSLPTDHVPNGFLKPVKGWKPPDPSPMKASPPVPEGGFSPV